MATPRAAKRFPYHAMYSKVESGVARRILSSHATTHFMGGHRAPIVELTVSIVVAGLGLGLSLGALELTVPIYEWVPNLRQLG